MVQMQLGEETGVVADHSGYVKDVLDKVVSAASYLEARRALLEGVTEAPVYSVKELLASVVNQVSHGNEIIDFSQKPASKDDIARLLEKALTAMSGSCRLEDLTLPNLETSS